MDGKYCKFIYNQMIIMFYIWKSHQGTEAVN